MRHDVMEWIVHVHGALHTLHTHTYTSQGNDDITIVLQLRDTRAFATTYVSCIFIDILTDLRERERERKGGGKDTHRMAVLCYRHYVCAAIIALYVT